jgi:hypothetical protein
MITAVHFARVRFRRKQGRDKVADEMFIIEHLP